jgi:hypothetical protein
MRLGRPGSHRERMRRNGYPAPKPQRSAWSVIGIALGTLLCVGGLVFLGVMVYAYIALSHFASNK